MVAPSLISRLRVLVPALLLAAAGLAAAEEGARWKDLTPAQQSALRPLEAQWAQIDGPRKQKWIEIAGRFPTLPHPERDRIQARMAEWAKLTPSQRRDARMNYQAAQQVPQQNREARWEAYQALPADQRRQLATPPAPAARAVPKAVDQAPQAKSNIVPNPAHGAAQRAVAPTIVQAKPGATTSLMSAKPVPPAHQQTGMPKIAATPGFVDKSTLLPQRGPQGAAVRSAAASEAGTGRP
jgi:hypothetical protein